MRYIFAYIEKHSSVDSLLDDRECEFGVDPKFLKTGEHLSNFVLSSKLELAVTNAVSKHDDTIWEGPISLRNCNKREVV